LRLRRKTQDIKIQEKEIFDLTTPSLAFQGFQTDRHLGLFEKEASGVRRAQPNARRLFPSRSCIA